MRDATKASLINFFIQRLNSFGDAPLVARLFDFQPERKKIVVLWRLLEDVIQVTHEYDKCTVDKNFLK